MLLEGRHSPLYINVHLFLWKARWLKQQTPTIAQIAHGTATKRHTNLPYLHLSPGASKSRSKTVPFCSGPFRKMTTNTSPIWGEYKLWILRRFLIPSFHFVLSVNVIPDSSIKKVQSQCTRKIKSWLGLTRGVTNASQCYWHSTNLRVSYKSKINIPLLYLYLEGPNDHWNLWVATGPGLH